jgi:hypothetical protein
MTFQEWWEKENMFFTSSASHSAAKEAARRGWNAGKEQVLRMIEEYEPTDLNESDQTWK